MKKRMKKLASLLLSVSMTFSMISFPVYATPADDTENETAVTTESPETEEPADAAGETTEPVAEEQETTQPETTNPDTTEPEEQPEEEQPTVTPIEENFIGYTVHAEDIDVSGVSAANVKPEGTSTADESNQVISTIDEELSGMTVRDEEGNEVALSEEQIQNIKDSYQAYLNQWKEHADVLGVQLPFFLSYREESEDGLGILGEMLVLAGHTVDEVRSGEYTYDDLMGMIMNFHYADKFAVDFYSDAVKNAREEVIEEVEKSGATTEAQKLLVINDWLAHHATFDMAYIMKDEDGNPIMVADGEPKNEHYDEIYDTMYAIYEQQIRQQFRDNIAQGIKDAVYKQALEQAQAAHDDIYNQIYQSLLDNNMEDNDDTKALAEEKTQEQIEQIAQDAVNDVVENGMPATDENGNKILDEDGNQVRVPFDTVIDQQMDKPLDDLNGMTPNDAIPIYAQQAATGLTEGIIGAWEGNHIGIFAEGTGVCAGYSKALAYLIQYMHPEKYGINGAETDMSVAANWKTPEELYYKNGELNIEQDYLVDMVRITFSANVSMFGEASTFGEVHFWNAVKVDGQWYYVDPCYTDIYVECMSRDRVEIDGTMNHMYFLFSHDTAVEMYKDNIKDENSIATLYASAANDKKYESSWYARIASNAYSDGEYFYYLYDSTDQLAMMREFQNMDEETMKESDFEALLNGSDPNYKLVRHEISESLVEDGADPNFTTLIEFNPKDEESDETTDALVYNPKSGSMEKNEILTDLFERYKEDCDIYPSIKLTTALYNGKLYFNLSNCILSYSLESGAVEIVKEYNKVSGKRDYTNPFGGMAFTKCEESEADFTFTNHPIAAMTIKDDQMYVSVATNLGFISGKNKVNDHDSDGYEFEESNYNPNYSSYTQESDYSDEKLAEMGYSKETNDNDEFMWSAVFVDTIEMGTTCDHDYETVTETFCGRDGYTENRCTKCGAVETESRVVNEDTACDHHYVRFDETYYTKDSDGNWNTGYCYVCTVCGFAIEEPTEPSEDSSDKQKAEYEKEKKIWDYAVEHHGHTYEPTDAQWSEDSSSVAFSNLQCSSVCPEKKSKLDCLLNDETISVELAEETTAEAEVTGHEGECSEGVTDVYTAEGEVTVGKVTYKYTATNKVKQEVGEHSYTAEFTWTPNEDEEAEVPYNVTVGEITCEVCGQKLEGKTTVEVVPSEESVPATCVVDGTNVYVATATVKAEDGTVLGTVTDEKTDVVEATGHDWSEWETVKAPTETEEGEEQRTCSKCEKVETNKIAPLATPSVEYRTHVQDFGWQATKADGETAGTSGVSKRLEAIEIKLADNESYTGSIEYRTHVQDIGWQGYVKDGATAGTSKQSKRLEAIQIRLTGDIANYYHVYYRVHAQDYGWLDWACDDQVAGTYGLSKRLEAIEIKLVRDGDPAPGSTNKPYVFKNVSYSTHVQDIGWQAAQVNGDIAGTTGKSKRLEAIKINLENQQYKGDIIYTTHIQDIGWQDKTEADWKKNGALSGTSGQSKRLESIRIKLTGEMAEHYDVYYRVHAQEFGWMGWASNGQAAGTAGYSYRLEAIQIQLVPKGEAAPGSTNNAFRQK